ncbi:hypothetical protein V2J09_015722, partial [Rumex salicifolius]
GGITNCLLNRRLSVEESHVVVGSAGSFAEHHRWSLCLVGKILTDRPVSIAAFRSTLKQLWKIDKGFPIREVGQHLFVFQFFCKEDKDRLGHIAKSCPGAREGEDEASLNQYRPWLRASIDSQIHLGKEDHEMECTRIKDLMNEVERMSAVRSISQPCPTDSREIIIKERVPLPRIQLVESELGKRKEPPSGIDVDIVNNSMNDMLLCRPTAEEIRVDLFQIHPTKAPDKTESMRFSIRSSGELLAMILMVRLRWQKLIARVLLSRGICQGDPLSPFLFVICEEVFSCLLDKVIKESKIYGLQICRITPKLSHLFFVDDNLIFTRANLNKCAQVSFSENVNVVVKAAVIGCLGVKEVDRHGKVFGIANSYWEIKEDRIWKRLQGWHGNLLSKAGKEVLIKSVLHSIPIYIMSIFRLPDNLISEILSMISRFW